MAVWMTKPEKQREINEYFASINSMTLRIIEDIQKVKEDYQTSWKNFTTVERDEKIDEYMITEEALKNYPLPKTEGPNLYPTQKMDTGQKLVEIHTMTDKNEVTSSWRDEHSGPFSLQSKSQMDLRLPPSDGKPRKKKKRSSGRSKKQKDIGIANGKVSAMKKNIDDKSLNGSVFDNVGLSTGPSTTSTESTGSRFYSKPTSETSSHANTEITDTTAATTKITDSTLATTSDIQIDWKNDFMSNFDTATPAQIASFGDGKQARENLPDISFDNDFFKGSDKSQKKEEIVTDSKKYDIKPSYDLNFKTYDASEFMDLYPQPKTVDPKPIIEDTFTKPREVKPKLPKGESKHRKKPHRPTEKAPPAPEIEQVKLRSKSHHKKTSSTSSNQVNPRSSLTLDGAIHNLEIAVEINRQGTDSQIPHEKVFGDETDLLKQIEKDTDLDKWLADSPRQDSPLLAPGVENADDSQKTGFDFLDNW